MTVPYPDPVMVAALATVADAVSGRVATVLTNPYPSMRITKVGDREAPTTWEATPIYTVEVWADDEFTAGGIAWGLANTWPSATATRYDDAIVHGRWVEMNPRPAPDPESNTPRYLIDLGIRLSGANPT